MMATPKLFKDEAQFGKLVQGALSDGWFLNAVATMFTNPTSIRDLFVRTGQEDPEGRFAVQFRAGKGCEIPNFKGSYLGRFLLVLAHFWTSDHLSERSRIVAVVSGTRARGTATLKRR